MLNERLAVILILHANVIGYDKHKNDLNSTEVYLEPRTAQALCGAITILTTDEEKNIEKVTTIMNLRKHIYTRSIEEYKKLLRNRDNKIC